MSTLQINEDTIAISSQEEILRIAGENTTALIAGKSVDSTAPTDNQILQYNADQAVQKWESVDLSAAVGIDDTDDLTEGTANLYFTDARAVSAVENESTLDLTGQLTVYNASEPLKVTRNANNNNSSIALWKDVGASGDMASRVGTYSAITDGTTTKYLGLDGWRDDATNGKQYNMVYLSDNGTTSTLLIEMSENGGVRIPVKVVLENLPTTDPNNAGQLFKTRTGGSGPYTLMVSDG